MNISSLPKTAIQSELFQKDRESFAFLEQALKVLSTKTQREHFRKLYLEKYNRPEIVFPNPNGEGVHYLAEEFICPHHRREFANQWLEQTLTNIVEMVLNQYSYNFDGWAKFNDPNLWVNISEAIASKSYNQNALTLTQALSDLFNTTADKKSAPFYTFTSEKIKELAQQLAHAIDTIQRLFIADMVREQEQQGVEFTLESAKEKWVKLYLTVALVCHRLGFTPPQYARHLQGKKINFDQMDREIIQLGSKSWWQRTLKKAHIRINEHIRIACREVSRKTSLYVSAVRLREFQRDQQEQMDWIKSHELVNQADENEVKDMFEMWLKSSSNPQKRSTKISVQNNGIMNSLSATAYDNQSEKEQAQRQAIWDSLNDIEKQILTQAMAQGKAQAGKYQPVFFTLTAPSKYHAINSRTMEHNPNWNGYSPERTHKEYLNGVWRNFRAQMSKYGIKMAGLRVAEPHHDGTPHWHLLLHASKEPAVYRRESRTKITVEQFAYLDENGKIYWQDCETANDQQPLAQYEVMIYYFKQQAFQEDGNEAGAEQYRFNYKVLERRTYIDENGNEREVNPAVYMAKYIRKNITGNGLTQDFSDEALDLDGNQIKTDDHSLRKTALNAVCWASTWGIRQFQFLGNTQSGVWEECRKYKGNLNQLAENDPLTSTIIKTADKGDFSTYLLLKGNHGVFTHRKKSHLTLHYEERQAEATGLTYKLINGIQTMEEKAYGIGNFILTKVKNWKLRLKTKDGETGEDSGITPPWVCVINCNHQNPPENLKNSPPRENFSDFGKFPQNSEGFLEKNHLQNEQNLIINNNHYSDDGDFFAQISDNQDFETLAPWELELYNQWSN